ncbi:diguanylate cyclase/phosphodiesterase with PAS/PAC and GAF sensor(s) [[Leptolyngbya] sp. PCC 7376]|uniref:EAL domain-containing protein n=1 Tax=[Leptolyngbya] sp. PCC 7376 TaxID=111781 RepID=UPI00029F4802|nr:EAL domain-containing protein [[Leptolyngbya] sp. PCC 7376]AFY36829.1 diguanylate cyclase/phosphodiesterase with PAS/PAC and GAF sensor(s) [[Leptolyngbya] sp. PCC 7376]
MDIKVTGLTQDELDLAIVRSPLVVSPETMVMDVISQMSGLRNLCWVEKEINRIDIEIAARSSCVIVAENNQLLGILTERDVVRLTTQQIVLDNLRVSDVMSGEVITLRESEFVDIFCALNVFQQNRIRHLPVLDDEGNLTGLLTHESLQHILRPIDLLRLQLVKEIMATNVIYANAHVDMLDVATLMAERRISSVVIVRQQLDQDQQPLQIPIGIITERDIVQFKALGISLHACQVNAVMSSPVFSVQPEDSLWDVQQLMEERFIGRVAVTGSQGELLGIVTKTSVLQAFNSLELYKLAEILDAKVLRLEAEKIELLENRALELEHLVEQRTLALRTQAEHSHLLASVASQIRLSLELQPILDTTVEKLQAFLGCDRVAIWQFQSDHAVISVAEAISDKVRSQLGQRVYDPCFSPEWVDAYQNGRVRVVADIYQSDMAKCHLSLLEELQTRAKVLLPIIEGRKLWGLLEATESCAPRQWHPEEVTLLEQLATQLAIAIQQATAYQQAHGELIERRQTEIRLKESEKRLATLAATAPVGIYRTDAKGNCVYVNERWCRIAGIEAEKALGAGWMQGLHPSDQEAILNEWQQSIREERPFNLEFQFKRPDGFATWVFAQAVAEHDEDGQIIGYIGTITDISNFKQAQELILHHTLHDPLTNLPNRTLLMERLRFVLARMQEMDDYRYALLFLDLDGFKVINDSLGYLIGDQLLLAIARKLEKHVREVDFVARFGSDEFVILLEDIDKTEDIIQIVEQILVDFKTPLFIGEYEIFTSVSIGIVIGTHEYHQAADVIRDADIAMHRAKSRGRNLYQLFDSAMHEQMMYRLNLETSLRKAVKRKEFIVYYQPLVDILNRQLVGFEALVRWENPDHGMVSPADFVPIAEETGLVAQIDRYVFKAACHQLADWKSRFPDCFPLKMSINLSAQSLHRANLIEGIEKTLAETGLDGTDICLEVTESMVIDDIDQTIKLLNQLKARNIQISIDDFGTGYSSLSYLHRLPANNLKIDRSFIGFMEVGDRNYQIVQALITLSKQLDLTVVAEGIETKEQLQWLQDLECQLGQGYLFSKPLGCSEIEKSFLAMDVANQSLDCLK